MTPIKAAGVALTKVAEAQMKLALQLTDAAELPLTLSDLPDALDEGALLLILGAPDGRSGLLAISPIVLAALIERRTTGRIGTQEVPQRRPTRTDAAIAAGYFDPVLRALAEVLAGTADGAWADGYRFAAVADDTRSVLLKLDDTGFRALRLQLRLTEGASRTGGLLLVLPVRQVAPRPATDDLAAAAAVAAGATGWPAESLAGTADWSARIEAAVMDAPTLVTGVLWRVSLSLKDVLSLAPGTEIPIPRDALDRIPLEGTDGRVLARGRLGQSRGHRAIRVRIGDGPAAEEDDRGGAAGVMPSPAAGSAAGRHANDRGILPPADGLTAAQFPSHDTALSIPMSLDLSHELPDGDVMPMALDMAFSTD